QFRSSVLPIIHGIVAIRGVKQVDIAGSRVKARADDFLDLAQSRRSDGAAAAADLEKIGFAEFPRVGGMGDENDVDRAILAPQSGGHPEEERLGQLPVALRHACGYVQQEEYRGAQRRLAAASKLPEPKIFIDERRCGRLQRSALDRFLQGAASV